MYNRFQNIENLMVKILVKKVVATLIQFCKSYCVFQNYKLE